MSYTVLLGGPCAGKGTQSKMLSEKLKIPQISTGDIFRELVEFKTEIGGKIKAILDRGDLVPDDVVLMAVKERLTHDDVQSGALFDGFPRNINQAQKFDEILTETGKKINKVLYINVDQTILLERATGRWICPDCAHIYHEVYNPPTQKGICDFDGMSLTQRAEDTEEKQKHRIDVYFKETTPLLDYYKEKGLLAEINGAQPIETVHREIMQTISS